MSLIGLLSWYVPPSYENSDMPNLITFLEKECDSAARVSLRTTHMSVSMSVDQLVNI